MPSTTLPCKLQFILALFRIRSWVSNIKIRGVCWSHSVYWNTLVHGCCTSVSLVALLAVSSRSCPPLSNMWRTASYDVEEPKDKARHRKSHDASPTRSAWLRICWLACKWQYSHRCCACKHLIWKIALIAVRCACQRSLQYILFPLDAAKSYKLGL